MSNYEFVSPIDRHRHFAEDNKVGCAVCELEAERDRLRAVIEALNARFVDHLDSCAVTADYPCDCGLDNVLAQRRQLDGSGTVGGEGTDARPDDGVDGPIGGVVGRPARAENERRAGGAGPRDRAGAGARREVGDADKWSFEWPSRESPTGGAGDE